MRLERQIQAPEFALHDLDGTPISNETFRGKRLYLILSRFAACPFCSLRLGEVAQHFPKMRERGVEVLVVFPSQEKRVRLFQKKYSPEYRIAADPEQSTFKAFGSETSWAGEMRTTVNIPKVLLALVRTKMNPLAIDDAPHRMPAEYLIGPEGKIEEVHYGAEMDDGFAIETVLNWADASSASKDM